MPAAPKRKSRPQPAQGPSPKPAEAQTQEDPLRSAAGLRRQEIIPLPVLIGIFIIVEVVIIWLMSPSQFMGEWRAFNARRYQAQGDFPAAIPPLSKLVEDNPDAPTFLGELANAYLNTGEYDKAIMYYELAQANRENLPTDESGDAPELPDYNTAIGVAYFRKGDLESAEKHLKMGLAHDKLNKIANFTLGEIEFQRGNFQKATDYFKVVAQDPGFEKRVRDYYSKIEEQLFKQIE